MAFLKQKARDEIEAGVDIVAVLNEKQVLNRRQEEPLLLIQFQLTKKKVNEDSILSAKDLINNQFVLLQSGKKNYFVVRIV
jgi:tyrosyl-tRNA synthetase